MFTYEIIQKFNSLELALYEYIQKHPREILYMTVRELADAVHVSTSTVMRFCKKTGCEGYTEFRFRFKMSLAKETEKRRESNSISEIMNYFKYIDNPVFDGKVNRIVSLVRDSNRIVFVGIGTSGAIEKYEARYFSMNGKFSHYIEDPFYPVMEELDHKTVVIALSVSGETEETVLLLDKLKQHGCQIVSITNQENATISRMSVETISYYMSNERIAGDYNTASQVPVIYIIEEIARRLPIK
ncbi:transcriptional regulator [Brochothrix thermosphacta]|uniref:MurR/RpiR family transcriptional regulator n=1 Tax=Brochothrix thermosphacta TaxID=2756 RepID=UPI000E70D4B4|nr:MurR/RpiR family transcriptional regulator [Brochothrix thermosphacta]ANZ93932.1 transcriptional regulator [Brochothrix thermosphacta]